MWSQEDYNLAMSQGSFGELPPVALLSQPDPATEQQSELDRLLADIERPVGLAEPGSPRIGVYASTQLIPESDDESEDPDDERRGFPVGIKRYPEDVHPDRDDRYREDVHYGQQPNTGFVPTDYVLNPQDREGTRQFYLEMKAYSETGDDLHLFRDVLGLPLGYRLVADAHRSPEAWFCLDTNTNCKQIPRTAGKALAHALSPVCKLAWSGRVRSVAEATDFCFAMAAYLLQGPLEREFFQVVSLRFLPWLMEYKNTGWSSQLMAQGTRHRFTVEEIQPAVCRTETTLPGGSVLFYTPASMPTVTQRESPKKRGGVRPGNLPPLCLWREVVSPVDPLYQVLPMDLTRMSLIHLMTLAAMDRFTCYAVLEKDEDEKKWGHCMRYCMLPFIKDCHGQIVCFTNSMQRVIQVVRQLHRTSAGKVSMSVRWFTANQFKQMRRLKTREPLAHVMVPEDIGRKLSVLHHYPDVGGRGVAYAFIPMADEIAQGSHYTSDPTPTIVTAAVMRVRQSCNRGELRPLTHELRQALAVDRETWARTKLDVLAPWLEERSSEWTSSVRVPRGVRGAGRIPVRVCEV